jgi:aminoglycoside phosphotransferase (APT) family kinase protein
MTDADSPPSATPGIDVAGVTAWMQRTQPAVAPPLQFDRIGDGRSNLTYAVTDAAGAEWVLRRPPIGPRLRGAHDMAREYRISSALYPAGVPVPEPYGIYEDDDITGAPFYLMELVRGPVIAQASDGAGLSPQTRAAIGQSLITTLAEMHAVDVDAVGLGDLARREQYAERQLKAWWRQWEASKDQPMAAVERVRDLLAAAVPPQRRVTVVHGDYKLENVILGEGGNVRAILDWELCTLGDPIADLGTLLVYWAEPTDPPEWSLAGVKAPSRAAGFPTRRELVEAYANASGADVGSIAFYEALGAWKLAIILQGVFRRFHDTPANANVAPETLLPVIDGLLSRADAIASSLR